MFLANGFIRIYMEILLDGILYAMVNMRTLKFFGFIDAFSYLFLLAFTCLVIFFTVFIVVYTKNIQISKWSEKIKEILTETNLTKSGVLTYQLVFTIRRLILCSNIIILGALDPNIHITFHAVCQFVVV